MHKGCIVKLEGVSNVDDKSRNVYHATQWDCISDQNGEQYVLVVQDVDILTPICDNKRILNGHYSY